MTAYTGGGIWQDVCVARLLTTTAPVAYTGGGIWTDECAATLSVAAAGTVDPPPPPPGEQPIPATGATTLRLPTTAHNVYAPRPA